MTNKILWYALDLLALIIGVIVASHMIRKQKGSPRKRLTKRDAVSMLKGFLATFLGPLLAAYLCSFGTVHITKVVLFALFSWFLTIAMCMFIRKNLLSSIQRKTSDDLEYYVFYLSLIIPSVSLYLMFLYLFALISNQLFPM